MKVILLGYMASGKSVIGKKLALEMDCKFYDLDAFLELQEKMTISEIFDKKGEVYFRKVESRYLEQLLDEQDGVISLGGGTPCYGNNLPLILRESKVFYLKANITTLYNRLVQEKDERPLVKEIGRLKLQEYIAKHLFERSPFYEQAYRTINVDGKKIDVIVNEIKNLL